MPTESAVKITAIEVRSRLNACLKAISKEPGASLMPSYRARLSSTELDDLVAFLASLGGTQ